jgi:hypothetical protein
MALPAPACVEVRQTLCAVMREAQERQARTRRPRACPIEWTDALDDRIRGLRGQGLTWDQVALAMGLGRNSTLERARKIGVRTNAAKVQPPPVAPREHLDRAPKAAGDADTWGLIVASTCMAGAAYSRPHDPLPSPVCLHEDGCTLRSVTGFSYCATHRARIYCVEI